MAEFTEILRLANKICRETENCEKCPMSLGDVECLFGYRLDYIMENAENIEKSIVDWDTARQSGQKGNRNDKAELCRPL